MKKSKEINSKTRVTSQKKEKIIINESCKKPLPRQEQKKWSELKSKSTLTIEINSLIEKVYLAFD
jgi:hypothetical protein